MNLTVVLLVVAIKYELPIDTVSYYINFSFVYHTIFMIIAMVATQPIHSYYR